MGTNRNQGLDAEAAERLLDGCGGEPARLARLLAAAAGPAHPEELAGEEVAAAAFHSAVRPSGAHRRPIRRAARRVWPRLLTAKAAGLAVAVAGAGIALAAGTGVLPSPLGGDASTTVRNPGSASPAGAGTGGTSPWATGTTPAAGFPVPPDPALPGLCRAYLAELAENPGKARSGPAFAALATAAGGPGDVTGFCRDVVATPATASPPAKAPPSQAGPHPSTASTPSTPSTASTPSTPSTASTPSTTPAAANTPSRRTPQDIVSGEPAR